VQNKEAVFAAIKTIPDHFSSIDVLINNAGLALGRDAFQDANLDDWETMIDTNVKGLLYVSKAVLPLIINNKKGHIINIGSTAGVEVYKEGNVYCASKHAVAAISKSMRIDLLPQHIKVTAIHPGAAETNFSNTRFKGDEAKASAVYEGYKALEAVDVANVAYYVTTLPDHVCINELVVTCTSQANSFYLQK
jgi:NADP-dependent 3-hydroxy acid dehydrogenase YdfG